MKNKIFNSFKLFLMLVILGLICLPFLKHQALKRVKGDYLKSFVRIAQQSVDKTDDDLSAKISVVIENSGDMVLDKIPLMISYLDAQKKFISSDQLDLLKMADDVVLANSRKSFVIDVIIPKGSTFINSQIMY